MIGRAGVGQPWLAEKLRTELAGEIFIRPTSEEIGEIFFEHIERLSKLLNNERFACIQARKFAKYYARNLTDKMAFCEQMNTCENLETLKKLCQVYFTHFSGV